MIILPSLEIVPAKYNSGTLLSQIPIDGTGDFTVSRTTSPVTGLSTRVNSLGLIETVNDNVPRLDYPLGGAVNGCPALLVEPSAANGILNSTDTTTNWALGANLTSGAIDVIGVSGNNLTVAASGSNIGDAAGANRTATINATLTSGSTYTISFLMKKTGAHTIGGFFANTSGATSTAFGSGFDVSGSFSSGPLIGTSPITNRIRRVERFGSDVFRCSETFTMTATNVLTVLRLGPTVSVTSLSNSAVGTTMGFAAPQIELGSVPTSFIPTTTGSVTRNADVISLTGVAGLIGQTEGTIYAEVDLKVFPVGGSPVIGIISLNVGAANLQNCIVLGIERLIAGTNRFYSLVQRANATQAGIFGPSISAGVFKVAFAYKENDFTMYVNGVQTGTPDTSGLLPSGTLNEVFIGTRFTGDTQFLNDRIRAAALYPTRLTDTQLALLTSPYTSYSSMASALSYTLG